jgi:hypothetical protein
MQRDIDSVDVRCPSATLLTIDALTFNLRATRAYTPLKSQMISVYLVRDSRFILEILARTNVPAQSVWLNSGLFDELPNSGETVGINLRPMLITIQGNKSHLGEETR